MGEVVPNLLRFLVKLVLLIVLPYEGLDHAHPLDVLLHAIVHRIIALEDADEDRMRLDRDAEDNDSQNRNHDQENQRHFSVDGNGHHNRKNDHQWRTKSPAYQHCEGVLDVRDIGCHAGNQGSLRKAIDVVEGIGLYAVKDVLPQILCQPAGGLRGLCCGCCSEEQGDK